MLAGPGGGGGDMRCGGDMRPGWSGWVPIIPQSVSPAAAVRGHAALGTTFGTVGLGGWKPEREVKPGRPALGALLERLPPLERPRRAALLLLAAASPREKSGIGPSRGWGCVGRLMGRKPSGVFRLRMLRAPSMSPHERDTPKWPSSASKVVEVSPPKVEPRPTAMGLEPEAEISGVQGQGPTGVGGSGGGAA